MLWAKAVGQGAMEVLVVVVVAVAMIIQWKFYIY